MDISRLLTSVTQNMGNAPLFVRGRELKSIRVGGDFTLKVVYIQKIGRQKW